MFGDSIHQTSVMPSCSNEVIEKLHDDLMKTHTLVKSMGTALYDETPEALTDCRILHSLIEEKFDRMQEYFLYCI